MAGKDSLRPGPGSFVKARKTGPRKEQVALSALSSFEQALKCALTGRICAEALGGQQFIAVVTDLTWALLQMVANDGTRLAHHLEVEQFPVPPGWRAPIMLHTLSRVDLRFSRAILAIITCLSCRNTSPPWLAPPATSAARTPAPACCASSVQNKQMPCSLALPDGHPTSECA